LRYWEHEQQSAVVAGIADVLERSKLQTSPQGVKNRTTEPQRKAGATSKG
jgi:hypothetical protein